jgi:ribonuclease VapC
VSGLVVDTSALLAALFGEPQRDAVLVALAEADAVLLSSCCLLEATIVAQSRLGPEGQAELERLLDAFGVEISTFTADQATVAGDTWRRFGKGRHPAALNIIDCCSYALARAARLPLLAIGHDFARTDIELAELLGYR